MATVKRTVTIPEEIDQGLRALPDGEVSRYIATAIAEKQRRDALDDVLREAGYRPRPDGVAAARRRFAANEEARRRRLSAGDAAEAS